MRQRRVACISQPSRTPRETVEQRKANPTKDPVMTKTTSAKEPGCVLARPWPPTSATGAGDVTVLWPLGVTWPRWPQDKEEDMSRQPHIIIDRDTLSMVLAPPEMLSARSTLRRVAEEIAERLQAEGCTTEIDLDTTGRIDDASEIPSIMDRVLIGQVDEIREVLAYT